MRCEYFSGMTGDNDKRFCYAMVPAMCSFFCVHVFHCKLPSALQNSTNIPSQIACGDAAACAK